MFCPAMAAPLCKTHKVACMRKSAGPSAKSPGREFWCCAVEKDAGGCGFQAWCDVTPAPRVAADSVVSPACAPLTPTTDARFTSMEAHMRMLAETQQAMAQLQAQVLAAAASHNGPAP
jgi:hypothetical protein